MAKKIQAKGFKLMSTFQCVGDQCPDHCCWQWDIPLDKGDMKLVKKVFPKEEFWDKRDLDKKIDNPKVSHKLRFDGPGRSCHFLDEGWCRIHRDHGEEFLPKPCAAFPRLFNIVGDGFELTGDLACPEVARKLLFEEDALDWVPLDDIHLPDFIKDTIAYQNKRVKENMTIKDFKAFALALLQNPQIPVGSSLFCLLYLTQQAQDKPNFWKKSLAEFEDPKKLERKLRRYNVEILKRPDFPEEYWAPLFMAYSFVAGSKSLMTAGKVFYETLDVYGIDRVPEEGSYEPLCEAYRNKQKGMSETRKAMMTRALHRFWVVALQNSKAVRNETFGYFAREIIFHTINLRFLMVAMLEATEPGDESADQLALALTIQRYWKTLGHNSARLKYLVDAMEGFGFKDLDDYRKLLGCW